MAFTGTYLTTSFKRELLEGRHDFRPGGNAFRLALYTNAAALDASTTSYTAAGEIPDTGDYAAGGILLTGSAPVSVSTTAAVSFDPAVITGGTFAARGALLYNADTGGAVAVLDFGADRVSSGGTFEVQFAPALSPTAVVRIL
jgi:hypothetical protein